MSRISDARIAALLAFDIDAKLPKIAAPVLISASHDDMLAPYACSQRLAERLPNATLDVCAWGGHGDHMHRGDRVAEILRATGRPLWHLGLTQGGQPKHPLYIKSGTPLQTFNC